MDIYIQCNVVYFRFAGAENFEVNFWVGSSFRTPPLLGTKF